jgi:predicted small secreted protein
MHSEEVEYFTEGYPLMTKIRFACLALALLSGLALSGCGNTVNGMGRDIEKAGQNIQKSF